MSNEETDFRSNEELQKLIQKNEASLQAKGRLIDNMAYQIRTLSNAVIGFSDLLLSEQLTDELREYVGEINQAGNGLSALVNEVLDWAKLESARLQITKKESDLAAIIQELERILSSAASNKGLGYDVEIDPDLPAQILTDQDRLLKCLVNLVANAFKYTTEGSVRIRILSHYQDDKPCVRFDVIDSGAGIDPDKIEHLFEPVVRQEDAQDEVLTMLDMGFSVAAGLPLTKQLVELLGGHIQVSSELNVESIFSVILPIGIEDENVPRLGTYLPEAQFEPIMPDETGRIPLLLLVEDQQSNRTVISLMLEALGVSVDTAEDGQEGAEKAIKKDYDLILMDLKMPRMDGYEATRIIRETKPDTPIIALSAKVLNERENIQIASLFSDFLTKPVDSHKLSEAIGKYVFSSPKTSSGNQTNHKTEETVTFEYGN